jgi:hypothetical protein
MYAKINGGTVTHFPYTFGQLRKDNPNVSFPKNITAGVMQKFGMVGVLEGPKPTPTAYQTVQRNALPTHTETDQANYWMINYTAVDMFADTTDEDGVTTTKAQHEAAYQTTLDTEAAKVVRAKRDTLLAETDYLALTDNTLDSITSTYRQALRDITNHTNFPHLAAEDWPTKPQGN